MTRRLLATALLACVVGGLGVAAQPAHANHDDFELCIGGDDQNRPGYTTKLCVHDVIRKG
jgi:hypothetical protein